MNITKFVVAHTFVHIHKQIKRNKNFNICERRNCNVTWWWEKHDIMKYNVNNGQCGFLSLASIHQFSCQYLRWRWQSKVGHVLRGVWCYVGLVCDFEKNTMFGIWPLIIMSPYDNFDIWQGLVHPPPHWFNPQINKYFTKKFTSSSL